MQKGENVYIILQYVKLSGIWNYGCILMWFYSLSNRISVLSGLHSSARNKQLPPCMTQAKFDGGKLVLLEVYSP